MWSFLHKQVGSLLYNQRIYIFELTKTKNVRDNAVE